MYTSFWARTLLFGTVFVTGAAVLILEVAAIRLLAPNFGASLFVLSSVLSTVLFALSLGYFIGGRMADKRPHHLPLYTIIMAAGVSQLLLLLGSLQLLEPGTLYRSQITGPLVVSLLFFFLPAFLLGMDSPYVIKLLSIEVDRDHNGAYIGTTFFWSTVGSIVGSLSAGFLLIPNLGVTATLSYTALIIVLLGAVMPWLLPSTTLEPKQLVRFLSLSVVMVLTSLYLTVQILNTNWSSDTAILSYDGLYSHIEVQEARASTGLVCYLRRDTNRSSAVTLGTTEHVFSYSRFVDLYDELVPEPERFLMIGGGAYTMPRRVVYQYPEVTVDVAEIEPSLYPLAQEYFDLTDTSRINNYVLDGRIFLAQSTSTYDLIFTDAFNTAHNAPFHLSTQEFYRSVADHLTPDGALITNYIGLVTNERDSMTSAMFHTISSVFPHVYVFQSQPTSADRLQNIIFIARQSPFADDFLTTDLPFKGTPYSLAELKVDNDFFATTQPKVLTDDHAPVEYLMAKQLQASR